MANSKDEVKRLREETGAGVMDCKRALEEAKGDFDRAKSLIKERGLVRAQKKAVSSGMLAYRIRKYCPNPM